jgi:DNA modification methylase
MATHRIIQGDCLAGLRTLPDASVHCCVTSPPYWGLRDYGHDGQIGLESTPEEYVARMVEVFREVRRVLREDGTLWLNLGDSYANNGVKDASSVGGFTGERIRNLDKRLATGVGNKGVMSSQPRKIPDGLKPKDLVGIPWRVAFALQADGWWLRQDIIWHKPNPMPESVRDRCTKAHEYVFLLTKSQRYFYDAEAVSEASKYPDDNRKARQKPEDYESQMGESGQIRAVINPSGARTYQTRNRRSVWTVTAKPYKGAHFATMPPDLVEPCIKAGCPEQCCPVCGKGWERAVEKTRTATRPDNGSKYGSPEEDIRGGSVTLRERHIVSTKTTGFAPACDCGVAGTASGTVLDPFAGSGTTLAVAAQLGRSGIGCELNPEYIELAEQRIAKAKAKAPLFAAG